MASMAVAIALICMSAITPIADKMLRLHPLSKSTKALARRDTRQGEDPSRASAVSALRSSSLRKPDRIMRATESARSKIARNFYRLFNESGYSDAGAQQPNRPPNLNLGDAVVTGFSGTVTPD